MTGSFFKDGDYYDFGGSENLVEEEAVKFNTAVLFLNVNSSMRWKILQLIKMLKRFAVYGDKEDFRGGYKKVSSGDLVDCRNLLKSFGEPVE